MYYDTLRTYINIALGMDVDELPLERYDGLVVDNRIGIRKNIETHREKSCVLAEELGHVRTSTGNILNYDDVGNKKQENHAREYAYNFMLGMSGIVWAWMRGCRNLYEIAETLECTEQFLKDALEYYHSKYGISTQFGPFTIYFEPALNVVYRRKGRRDGHGKKEAHPSA